MSVITYAVAHVKVSSIIVCGHTRCGGVDTCLDIARGIAPLPPRRLGKYLKNLIELARPVVDQLPPNPNLE